MNRTWMVAPVVAGALLLACSPESDQIVYHAQAMAFHDAEWSVPVNLGLTINTAAGEMNAAFSPDELSLYFTSNRAGGFGGTDIWVARRACQDCPWGAPVNMGEGINTPGIDAGPRLSIDGHLLFFQSDRPGGHGGADIYMARRANTNDDFAWELVTNLGPGVNTAATENAADYLQSAEPGQGNFYFNRTNPVNGDIFSAAITRDGETRGDAVFVAELSSPTGVDQHVTVRVDGRELFYSSNRPGSVGGFDLYVTTRQDKHGPWAAPVGIAELNTTFGDQQPTLSHDGRTLLFASDRPGGSGGQDLWIATRRPSGQ
jgi:Tol biopolymer transport system component